MTPSSTRRLLRPIPTYFVDRNLGRHDFPTVLREAGLAVEVHDDHFPQDTPDVDWLGEVASRGWVVVTGDKAILRNTLEMAAIRESCAVVLVVIGLQAPVKELARNFVHTQHRIRKFLAAATPPVIAKVYRPDSRRGPGKPGRIKPFPVNADGRR